jgi:hypothetical protein
MNRKSVPKWETGDQWISWVMGEARRMTWELGLEKVPLRRSEYSLYSCLKSILYRRGFRGQERIHLIYRITQELFFRESDGRLGPLYYYPQHYRKTKREFDVFFLFLFRQRVSNHWRGKQRHLKRCKWSIVPLGETPVQGEISEGQFPQDSPVDLRIDQEETTQLFQEVIPQVLREQRHSELTLRIWEYLITGLNLQDIAHIFNQEGTPTPGGNYQWQVGTVSRIRDRILQVVRDYFGYHHLEADSFSQLR